MKKLSLGIITLLIAGTIYYFTSGSEQITAEIKKQLNNELTSIQKEGFSVQNREIKEVSEHFILSFDDPKKIAQFFSRQGLHINANDTEILKGLRVGIDIKYLADTYSSVAFDMYPVALPSVIISSATSNKDKKILSQVEKMLEKKTFLMHIAINKLGNGFKGHMSDIDEILNTEQTIKLNMKGLTFSGNITNNSISSVEQQLIALSLHVVDKMQLSFTGVKSDYLITGKTPYNYTTKYDIDKIHINVADKFNLLFEKLLINSVSLVKDGLASGSLISSLDKINMTNKAENYVLNTFTFESNAEGLDISAFKKLQEIDVNNKKEVNKLLQEMLSKGVSFEIPKCSIVSMESEGKKIDGFNITAKVALDKSFDVMALDTNPLSTLSAIDANLSITLSKELFGEITKIPQAMMALMLFQPKDVNGQKVYKLELEKGKITVNGRPFL